MAPANVLPTVPVIQAIYTLGYRQKSRVLSYKREYTQCGDGKLTYLPQSYLGIKALAEDILRSDNHTIICKPAPSAATPAAAQP